MNASSLGRYNSLLASRLGKGMSIRNYYNRYSRKKVNAKRERALMNALKYKYGVKNNINVASTIKRAKNIGYKPVSLVNKNTTQKMNNFLQKQKMGESPAKKSFFSKLFSKKNNTPTQKQQENYAIKKTINNASLNNQLYWAKRLYNKRSGLQKMMNKGKKAVSTYFETRKNQRLNKLYKNRQQQMIENAKHKAMVAKPRPVSTTPPPPPSNSPSVPPMNSTVVSAAPRVNSTVAPPPPLPVRTRTVPPPPPRISSNVPQKQNVSLYAPKMITPSAPPMNYTTDPV